MASYEQTVYELIQTVRNTMRVQPLNLGGTSIGVGGPPGGFIGYLPQTRVAYDSVEAATLATSGSGSLLDNLNHIRYRINNISGGGGGISDGDKGDITVSAGGSVWIVDDNVITETKLSLSDNTTADVNTSNHGYFPKLPASTGKFLRDDLSWQVVSGSGGASVLDDLTDVTIASPSDGEVLTYETSSLLWKNKPSTGFTPDFSIWMPDAKPTTPNALDDEFDDNSLAVTWTTYDPSSNFNFAENERGLNVVSVISVVGTPGAVLREEEMLSDYTIYTKLKHEAETGEAGIILCQDAVTNPTTSDLLVFGWKSLIGATGTFSVDGYTAYDAVASSVIEYAMVYDIPVYLAVWYQYNAGTPSFYFFFSLDGETWIQAGSGSVGFVPKQFGLYSFARDVNQDDARFQFFRVKNASFSNLEGNRVAMKFA